MIGAALLAALAALGVPQPARAADDWSEPGFYRQAQQYMLEQINRQRGKKGLQLVALDAAASQVAKAHAEDMLNVDYFSHWDTAGLKPTRRWNLLGGFDSVSENIYYSTGYRSEMRGLVDEAMKTLMNSSGHRATIMDPAHTHVGIGYAVQGRSFYVDQTFVTRAGGDYSCPLEAAVGETVEFCGQFDPQRYEFEQVIMGYEELPRPRDRKWLNKTDSYRDAEHFVAGFSTDRHIRFQGMQTSNDVTCEDGSFSCSARLDFKGREGLYYLSLWLRDRKTGRSFQAAAATVEARR